MKTLKQIYSDFESDTIDGRDVGRLIKFIPEKDLHLIGVELKEEYVGRHEAMLFTRENVIEELKSDVAFGFEKALNQRGISAGLMFSVVAMWNWILEEGLEDYDENNGYAQYGLPLFKATALKYKFDNPIGNDSGDEEEYASY